MRLALLIAAPTIAWAVGCGPMDPSLEEKDEKGDDFGLITGDVSCPDEPNSAAHIESGNMGKELRSSPTQIVLTMRNDNGDCRLPRSYRNWWLTRLDAVSIDQPTTITLTNRGWSYLEIPVYSYDGVNWIRFDDRDVTQPANYTLRIRHHFQHSSVYIAQFYPYRTSDYHAWLRNLCGSIKSPCSHPLVTLESSNIRFSGNPIHLITLTDPSVPDHQKRVAWFHARTHPGEVGGSFAVEGIVRQLLEVDRSLLKRLIVRIVPLHNPTGTVAGNYRTNTDSRNLEVLWLRDPENPLHLQASVPDEVKILHGWMLRDILAGREILSAINIHGSVGDPDRPAFFFPHFGPRSKGYNRQEERLFLRQKFFINQVDRHYEGPIYPPREGGRSFVHNSYPESWWWHHAKENVMAMTVETTYSRAGFDRWITPDDHRSLGAALARATADYARYRGTETPEEVILSAQTQVAEP